MGELAQSSAPSSQVTAHNSFEEDELRIALGRVASAPHDLQTIVEMAPLELIAFDKSRLILCANRAAEAFFGYAASALRGRFTEDP